MFVVNAIAVVALAAWIYLVFGRGGFWRIHLDESVPGSVPPRSVAVVIPARNEAKVIQRAVESLLTQEYPGRIHIFLVDDHSGDGTATAAGSHPRLTVLSARPLPPTWTGKLWAVSEGVQLATALNPDYILLTDADIVHLPQSIGRLVARAESGCLDLVSNMVELECRTLAERALIPAFVFFFFMLYPPRWIADGRSSTAGAAGGCILIRPQALARIGGVERIRGELIDDCALARAVKKGGTIWLGVTREARSIREYATFGEIHRMIARTAFVQLNRSALMLSGTIIVMTMVYLAPPILSFSRSPLAAGCGIAAWLLMSVSYLPVLRLYRRWWVWAPILPLVAAFYMVATLDSARRHWMGRGGEWKGRVQSAT